MARLTFRRPADTASRPSATATQRVGASSTAAVVASGNIDAAFGPGWFESTFDLRNGLDVCEEIVSIPPVWQLATPIRGGAVARVACFA